MTEEEVTEIVSNAVHQTESNPENILPMKRAQMAQWLHKKFKIAIKELVVSIGDGQPYLKVEYLKDDGETGEAHVDMSKYAQKLTAQMEKAQNLGVKNAESK